MDWEHYEWLATLHREGTAHVSVTLINTRGEAPADVGAKAIVTTQGLTTGTVGGGRIEARVITYAQALLQEAKSSPVETKTWNLQTDIGMTCGGEVTLLFETFRPLLWQVAVFGAGHVAQALVRTLLGLDCGVSCFDARPEWIGRLPPSSKLSAKVMTSPEAEVSTLKPGTFFVVMTQGHATDVPVLEQIFRFHRDTPYVGAIGSELKGRKLKTELLARGVTAEWLEKLRCPVGLPLGNNCPAEIAISVTAELIQVRDRNVSR